MVSLHQEAAVGRLIQGLIHNLNGPLHALGIEMEMMRLVISKDDKGERALAQDILRRLDRMGMVFENLSRLIRSVAARAEMLQSPPRELHLNGLLRQEMELLQANLYFKHRVKTNLDLADGIPSPSKISDGLGLGMVWFVQGLVEEIERQGMDSLSIKTAAAPSGVSVAFTAGGGELSPGFQWVLNHPPDPLEISSPVHIGPLLAVQMLSGAQVAIEKQSNGRETQLRMLVPAP
jgi:hypothetical protein